MIALNRPEPPRLGDLAPGFDMDRSTLTAALKPLERDGLVTVTPDPQDRHAWRLHLTGKGATCKSAPYRSDPRHMTRSTPS
ncbi:MarR family transcriptional regulator [Thetidibacter halocola]|nr:MarR family transcriptional regulator [Thetidibacter halocola]